MEQAATKTLQRSKEAKAKISKRPFTGTVGFQESTGAYSKRLRGNRGGKVPSALPIRALTVTQPQKALKLMCDIPRWSSSMFCEGLELRLQLRLLKRHYRSSTSKECH